MRKAWILLPLLGIAGYFAIFGGEYSWFDLRRLERERKAQEAAVRATRQEVKALQARADSLARDSLALERLAREKYGLIRNGERLYRFADGTTTPAAPTPGGAATPAVPPESGAAHLQSPRSPRSPRSSTLPQSTRSPRDSSAARADSARKALRRKP